MTESESAAATYFELERQKRATVHAREECVSPAIAYERQQQKVANAEAALARAKERHAAQNMSAARREELLASTSLGRQILREKRRE
jgi:hypothetical protein